MVERMKAQNFEVKCVLVDGFIDFIHVAARTGLKKFRYDK
jgi:hypothetical protein